MKLKMLFSALTILSFFSLNGMETFRFASMSVEDVKKIEKRS